MKKILFFDVKTKIRHSIGYRKPLTAKALNRYQMEYSENLGEDFDDDEEDGLDLDALVIYDRNE